MDRLIKHNLTRVAVVGSFGFALAVLHLSGGREATAAISGAVSDPLGVAHGVAYVAIWLCVILVAPVFVLAAAGEWLLRGRFVRQPALTPINLDAPEPVCEIGDNGGSSFDMDRMDSGPVGRRHARLRRG